MSKSSAERVAAAKAEIESVDVETAKGLIGNNRYVFVDVRDSAELEAGKIPGSVHSHRGGLEFALDAASDFRNPELTGGRTLVMVCGSGGRAALATKLAIEFGHPAVCLEGGMKAWIGADGPLSGA
ncbi:MAG: rhodanese-like domain-containing protein [Henriciella sp.]|nr:rhodanese-like domain-containing protein [Henriciella sp.]